MTEETSFLEHYICASHGVALESTEVHRTLSCQIRSMGKKWGEKGGANDLYPRQMDNKLYMRCGHLTNRTRFSEEGVLFRRILEASWKMDWGSEG